MKVDVLVIGAGPTGMGAAVRLAELGLDHLVVEALDVPGGMARSVHNDGFTWDLGGHVIHSHFSSFDKAIAASGVPMLAVRRNGYVWMGQRLIPTPVQQHLAELPADLHADAPAENLAEYYRNNFGAALSGEFFEPYTFKMWAQPLDQISHEWTSLRSGSGARNVPKLGLATDWTPPAAEFFPYSEGGTGQLWHGIHAAATDQASFRFGTSVTDLDLDTRTATLSDGTQVDFTACVSTAPITTVLEWAGLGEVVGAVPLSSAAVHAVGFGFDGAPPEPLADKTYLHSPDADVPWYRATVLSNYDPGNAGDGRWNVLCEVSSSPYRPVRLEDAVIQSRESLRALGADPDRIASVWTTLVPMGYPVPTLGRDAVLREADRRLLANGVRSRGRFGGWRYESCNQDYSFAQGHEAVQNIVDESPEDAYWYPERF